MLHNFVISINKWMKFNLFNFIFQCLNRKKTCKIGNEEVGKILSTTSCSLVFIKFNLITEDFYEQEVKKKIGNY